MHSLVAFPIALWQQKGRDCLRICKAAVSFNYYDNSNTSSYQRSVNCHKFFKNCLADYFGFTKNSHLTLNQLLKINVRISLFNSFFLIFFSKCSSSLKEPCNNDITSLSPNCLWYNFSSPCEQRCSVLFLNRTQYTWKQNRTSTLLLHKHSFFKIQFSQWTYGKDSWSICYPICCNSDIT